jgi:mercuric ion transport protein
MPSIELIFDSDCPNTAAARAALRDACQQAGVEPQWQEWDRGSADSPSHARHYGSPTILVDGVDVAGAGTVSDAKACRLYRAADGSFAGTPETASIARSLRRAT